MGVRINTAMNFGQQPTNWRNSLAQLREKRKRLEQYYGSMSPYEKQAASDELNNLREGLRGMIENGALSDWDSALSGYQSAKKRVETERAAEVRRWEPQRLSGEMQVYSQLMDNALLTDDPAGEVKKIYQDAQSSGDLYKQRGAAEVARSVANKVILTRSQNTDFDIKRRLNNISQEAARDLVALRITPAIQAAEQAVVTAIGTIEEKDREMREIDQDLMGGPGDRVVNGQFHRALSRYRRDEKSGAITILAPDDPYGNRLDR